MFLVVKEDAHLSDKDFERDCSFFLAALERGEDIAEKCEGEAAFHCVVPVLLCREVAFA